MKYTSEVAKRLVGVPAADLLQILDKLAISLDFEGDNFVDLVAAARKRRRCRHGS